MTVHPEGNPMPPRPRQIRSDIAWSTADRIVVRGRDLPGEILGHLSLADFSFLQLTGRQPTPEQSRVYEALLITLVEHGLTPSALAARMTYAGAPESLQAAVAAGLRLPPCLSIAILNIWPVGLVQALPRVCDERVRVELDVIVVFYFITRLLVYNSRVGFGA